MKPKYRIEITWSDEDEAYIARIPALPGCISHGETVEEACRNILDAMEGYLASMEDHGDTPPEGDIIIEDLRRFGPVINISELARRSGINKNTLATRLRRGTHFSEEQARKIRDALSL